MKRISLGVIIGIILIVYWYMHDHPNAFSSSPAKQGLLETAAVFV